jgi:Xaa-Pro aminopeptidase
MSGAQEVLGKTAVTARLRLTGVAEQAGIRYADKIAQAGMQAAFDGTHFGATERQVAAAAELAMRSLGSEGMGIDTIVASGPNTRLWELRRDELILLTIAPSYEKCHAAIGRPLVIGHPPANVRTAMQVAVSAQRAAMDAMRPGTPGSQVEGAAHRGWKRPASESTFSTVVCTASELRSLNSPIFGPGNNAPLEIGMVLSIDVSLFHAPWGGLRYEDGYLITGTGAEPLADLPAGILTLQSNHPLGNGLPNESSCSMEQKGASSLLGRRRSE